MVLIYTDKAFASPLTGEVLWEGVPYYLDLAALTETEREGVIDAARLGRFAAFDRRNPVCPFAIHGAVGTLKIGGRTYDVRSRKLEMDRPGDEQFAALLADIDRIRTGLTFQYGAPTARTGMEVVNAPVASPLERLDFFQARMEGPDPGASILGILGRILRNPHHAVRTVRTVEPIETARRVDVAAYARAAGQGILVAANPGTVAARRAGIRARSGDVFLPRHVPARQPCLTYDTAENRFLRFFLEDIEAVCLTVLKDRNAPGVARADADRVLAQVRAVLSAPFFKGLGKLQHLPAYSPVLVGHEAYSRIYALYLRSRAGLATPLAEARRQLRQSPLKDIATLYEIWVFFRLAEAFLGNEGAITATDTPESALPQGTTWRAGNIAVSYNRTFSPKSGSYSVTLRPDVTVEIGDRLWLFDAKYKADRTTDIEDADPADAAATVKMIDLHKMHTYVDAIANARAALAVYPGTQMRLFPRERNSGNDLNDLCRKGGIGGLPLLPLGEMKALGEVVAAVKAASRAS